MPKGAGSSEAQSCVERWRKHMDYFWTPNAEQLLGLADLYNNDPGFKKNFDKIDPNGWQNLCAKQSAFMWPILKK